MRNEAGHFNNNNRGEGMSVVACRVYEDRIEIAADSITVRGWTQTKNENFKHAKLIQVNGLTIGGAGLTEEIALMQIFAETHKPKSATPDDLITFLSEFSDWKKSRTENGAIRIEGLIAFDGKVFESNGYLVREVATYAAIGAGSDYALSAMYLGHSPEKAVETACELSIYCEKPIVKFTVRK